jgi:iron complex outermembrane receptor protein
VFRVDTLPVTVHNSYLNRPTDLITQELRISSPANQTVEYTLGGFYSRQIQHRDKEGASVVLFGNPLPSSPVNAYRVSDDRSPRSAR